MTFNFPTYSLQIAILIGLWIGNILLGMVTLTPESEPVARDAGASLVLPLFMCLSWIGADYCRKMAGQRMAEIAGYRRRKQNQHIARTLSTLLERTVKKHYPKFAILALLMAFGYLSSQGLFWLDGVSDQHNMRRLFLISQAVPLWFFVLRFVLTITHITLLIKKYLKKHLSIQLFEIEEITPVCKIVLANFTFATAILACYPINLVFLKLPEIDQFVLTFFSCVLLVFLIVPIVITRNTLRFHQVRTLDRINSAIQSDLGLSNKATAESQRRLVDSDEKLQYVSDLLIVRKEIQNAPLWPLTAPFTVKMIALLILPLLAWTGAGVISQLVKGWI